MANFFADGKFILFTNRFSATRGVVICVQDFICNSSETKFGIPKPKEELIAKGTQVLATSISDVLEEYLRHHQNLDSRIEGRIVFK